MRAIRAALYLVFFILLLLPSGILAGLNIRCRRLRMRRLRLRFPIGNGLRACRFGGLLLNQERPELQELGRLVAGELVGILDRLHSTLR